jgi:hypothetical protein
MKPTYLARLSFLPSMCHILGQPSKSKIPRTRSFWRLASTQTKLQTDDPLGTAWISAWLFCPLHAPLGKLLLKISWEVNPSFLTFQLILSSIKGHFLKVGSKGISYSRCRGSNKLFLTEDKAKVCSSRSHWLTRCQLCQQDTVFTFKFP